MANIFALPKADADKLRSMELIVDLASCVKQLVENSCDAGAHWIEVKVDCSKYSVVVSDDGHGIAIDELR